MFTPNLVMGMLNLQKISHPVMFSAPLQKKIAVFLHYRIGLSNLFVKDDVEKPLFSKFGSSFISYFILS